MTPIVKMESRLDLLSSDLAQKLSQVNELKLRKIASAVCEIALGYTDLKSPLINLTSEALEKSPSINCSSLLVELKLFIDQLDEIQWNLKEQVDLGKETMPNYLKAFCNARIFNTLYCALDPNPYMAAAESVYEAYAATQDLAALEKIIDENCT
jgi:hypothetical protein